MMRLGLCLLWALLVLVPAAHAANLTKLTIDTASGEHVFNVEVAKDDNDRARGLMYRREIAPDYGMLFDFGREQPVSMWMQNTYVSLDMVFIRADGVVHRVEERTTPLSTRTIDSGVDVKYVLELAAGTAAKIGLKRGDKVEHDIIR
ncbi:DUF192 domain-containing protein [Flaviflagellibacter deserti]|uniref:DUF192 domain-containing protein n=1 Tax=Flaviflagellibacter deserti TaxID=2267266 RepID=A0ABV9Z2U6_9HYPH